MDVMIFSSDKVMKTQSTKHKAESINNNSLYKTNMTVGKQTQMEALRDMKRAKFSKSRSPEQRQSEKLQETKHKRKDTPERMKYIQVYKQQRE